MLVDVGVELGEACVVGASDSRVSFAVGVKLGEVCDARRSNSCVTGAICDSFGFCSEYEETARL